MTDDDWPRLLPKNGRRSTGNVYSSLSYRLRTRFVEKMKCNGCKGFGYVEEYNLNTERWRHETCAYCWGSGWISLEDD